LHPASLRSPLDKSGSTVESRFIDLSALAGWILPCTSPDCEAVDAKRRWRGDFQV